MMSNLFYSCITIYLLILMGIFYVKINIYNPLVWFVPFIAIYHLSVVIMNKLGLMYVYCAEDILISTYIAVSVCISIFILFFDNDKKYNDINNIISESIPHINIKIIKLIYISTFIISFTLLLLYISSGIQTKAEASVMGGIGSVLNYAFRIYILFAFFQFIAIINKNRVKLWVFLNSLYVLLSSLITGERDLVLICLVGFSLILFFARKIKKSQIILCGVIIFTFIPIMGEYKNILYKSIEIEKTSGFGLQKIFLDGEFISGGRNLNQIIENEKEYKWGESIINDFKRSIIPSFISKSENSIGWFAKKYHGKRFEEGQGLGFSLIAEGYMNAGYWGVFIWFVLVSSLIIYLYNRITNIYTLIMYIYMIPIFIYSLRGDLSTILSPLLKQVIIPIVLLKLIITYAKTYSYRRG